MVPTTMRSFTPSAGVCSAGVGTPGPLFGRTRAPETNAVCYLSGVASRAPGREEEFSGARDLCPQGEDVVLVGLDAVEDRRVELAGHDHWETPPPRDVAHPHICDLVEPPRPVYLEAHQRSEPLVDDA